MANFIRSVLAAARAILQSKTVTATTSAQTVTPDSGYDGLSDVTVNPQNHSGTSSTYTSNGTKDLGINHNIRYVPISVPNPTLSGDAAASDVLSGKTFYNSDYTKRTGTITSKAAATYNTSSSDQAISSGQYLSGTQTIKAVTTENIDAANIKSGVTIKVGDANSAGRIKNVTGTYSPSPSLQSKSVTATTSAQTVSPDSGYDGLSQVTVNPQSHSDAATTYTSNGTKDLGTNHNIRYVPISVPKGSLYSSRATLWSGSSSTFNSQTITLNSSMASYDYIVITAKVSSSSSATMEFYINVSNFRYNSTVSSTVTNTPALCMYVTGSTAYGYVRRCVYTSDTQINFSSAVRYTTSAASAQNSYLIPTKIEGLDYYVA